DDPSQQAKELIMSTAFMHEPHGGRSLARPWEWPLAPGEVRRIGPAPVPRWIDVAAGRVWLTPTRRDDLAADHWLAEGERLALPPGSEWLLEAWPSARVAVHEAPPAGG
ncbi:MAG: DUF2917 domain-containing protein, partial [Burkholderiaceae bacterium]|nr:DUF2917 domain-containing protein [Burkholderiaceae bacterium]